MNNDYYINAGVTTNANANANITTNTNMRAEENTTTDMADKARADARADAIGGAEGKVYEPGVYYMCNSIYSYYVSDILVFYPSYSVYKDS